MAKVIRLDRLAATKVGSLIRSGKYFDASDNLADVENGTLVEVEKIMVGEREIHKFTPFTEGAGKNVGIVCTPEIDKTKDNALISDFVNKADDTIRVFILQKADTYSIGNEGSGVDVDIDGSLIAEYQATEHVMGIDYNVYEVKTQ